MSQSTAGLRQERRELKYNYIPTATQSPEIAANMISCISCESADQTDQFLSNNRRKVLDGKGRISHEQAIEKGWYFF